jgi:putative phage-type endonuclease
MSDRLYNDLDVIINNNFQIVKTIDSLVQLCVTTLSQNHDTFDIDSVRSHVLNVYTQLNSKLKLKPKIKLKLKILTTEQPVFLLEKNEIPPETGVITPETVVIPSENSFVSSEIVVSSDNDIVPSETVVIPSENSFVSSEIVVSSDNCIVSSDNDIVPSEAVVITLETGVVPSENSFVSSETGVSSDVQRSEFDYIPVPKSNVINYFFNPSLFDQIPISKPEDSKPENPKSENSKPENPKQEIICSSPQTLPKSNLEKIEYFETLPRYKQKSEGWHLQRINYLTASTIASALGLSGPAARKALLLDKASYGKAGKFTGNCATHWGNKYEPVANAIYYYRNGEKIHEFGSITNNKYPLLAISPDGITLTRMLEIKCPYSRVINGKIKLEYEHQMQAQMAVCEYDNCDFLECKFEEVAQHCFWDDFNLYNRKEQGLILMYINQDGESKQYSIEYIYSPIEYYNNQDKLRQWEIQEIENISNDSTKFYVQTSYWRLNIYACQDVERDPQWILDSYPVFEAFWKEVEYYRRVGIHQLLKKDSADFSEPDSPTESGIKIRGFLMDSPPSSPVKTQSSPVKTQSSPVKTQSRKISGKSVPVAVRSGRCLL